MKDNIFRGKNGLITLFNSDNITEEKISKALKDIDSKETEQLFVIIAIHIGEIDRMHNILKIPSKGGKGQRENFRKILKYLSLNNFALYAKIVESNAVLYYTTLDNLIANRVKTLPKKKQVVEVIDMLNDGNTSHIMFLAKYISKIIKHGTEFEKTLVSKFLTRPKFSKRKKDNGDKRNLQSETIRVMKNREKFYIALSNEMNWKYVKHTNNINFIDLYKFKKKYNRNFESTIFAEKRLEFDSISFIQFLEKLPSKALLRVVNRLKTNKYPDLNKVYIEWKAAKEVAKNELKAAQEKLEEAVELGDKEAIANLKGSIKDLEKKSKVNVGGISLEDVIKEITNENLSENKLEIVQIEQFIQDINFSLSILPVIDCSGSMNYTRLNKYNISSYKVATFLTTLIMLKNQNKATKNILIRFGSDAELLFDGKGFSVEKRPNPFFTPSKYNTDKLIDKTLTFRKNYKNMINILTPNKGGTDLMSITELFKATENISDWINEFPVILIVSDGDFNNAYNSEESIKQFQKVLNELGWNGIIVIWMITDDTSTHALMRFNALKNVIATSDYSMANTENMFKNINDIEVIDIYYPLYSLFTNKRYDYIKNNI